MLVIYGGNEDKIYFSGGTAMFARITTSQKKNATYNSN